MSMEVVAPMPGTIVEILVNVGDQVAPDDDLVILESMKMENSIRSNRAGRIASVEVQVNASVTANQVLLRME